MENQLKKSEQSPIIMDIDKKPYWGQVGVTETQTRPVHAHGVVIDKWEDDIGYKVLSRAVRGPSPLLGSPA